MLIQTGYSGFQMVILRKDIFLFWRIAFLINRC